MSMPDVIYVAHVEGVEAVWQERKTFMPKADGSPPKPLLDLIQKWEPPPLSVYPEGHRFQRRLATVTVYRYGNLGPTTIDLPETPQ